VRGLFHELAFRLKIEAQLLAKRRERIESQLRRQERQGQLELGHRYDLREDERGYTLITDYPASWQTSARHQNRIEWSDVRAIETDQQSVWISFVHGNFTFVPRHAFAVDEHLHRVAATFQDPNARPRPAPR
jgi:hypothetical protein